MLNLICRRNLGSAKNFCYLKSFSFSSLKVSVSNIDSSSENEYPFAVNYLISKLGFSKEWALDAYGHVRFRSSKNPDAVIEFFKNQGFSDAQISNTIRNYPQILTLRPQDNILPKIEFLQSLGMSNDDIIKIVSSAGYILAGSLEDRMIPSFHFVKNMLKSNEDAIFAFKRFPGVLSQDLHKEVPLNADILRKAGVPEFKILRLFRRNPRYLLTSPGEFKKYVERVKELGFSPLNTNFLEGISVMRSFSKLNWNHKMDVYKSLGYSEDQILLAFRKCPRCMASSEEKIQRLFDYFFNEMGCDPSVLIGNPVIITRSLEKTIIPRGSVYQVLKSKGLLGKKTSFVSFLKHTNESFLERFVLGFADKVPELLNYIPVFKSSEGSSIG